MQEEFSLLGSHRSVIVQHLDLGFVPLSLAVLLDPLLGSTTLWQPWEMSQIGLCDHIWEGGRERHFYLWKSQNSQKL